MGQFVVCEMSSGTGFGQGEEFEDFIKNHEKSVCSAVIAKLVQ
jgi:hypothetical protein